MLADTGRVVDRYGLRWKMTSSAERPVDEEQDDGAHDRCQDAGALTLSIPADRAAQERGHEDDERDPTEHVFAMVDRTGVRVKGIPRTGDGRKHAARRFEWT